MKVAHSWWKCVAGKVPAAGSVCHRCHSVLPHERQHIRRTVRELAFRAMVCNIHDPYRAHAARSADERSRHLFTTVASRGIRPCRLQCCCKEVDGRVCSCGSNIQGEESICSSTLVVGCNRQHRIVVVHLLRAARGCFRRSNGKERKEGCCAARVSTRLLAFGGRVQRCWSRNR